MDGKHTVAHIVIALGVLAFLWLCLAAYLEWREEVKRGRRDR
jgi:hypothetical protein